MRRGDTGRGGEHPPNAIEKLSILFFAFRCGLDGGEGCEGKNNSQEE